LAKEAQIFNLSPQRRFAGSTLAEFNSAIQQIENLRYFGKSEPTKRRR